MKEERKLILKLGQMITDRVGVKVTVEDPEYWGLAEVLTDEMAEVCLSMKVRKHWNRLPENPAKIQNVCKSCWMKCP